MSCLMGEPSGPSEKHNQFHSVMLLTSDYVESLLKFKQTIFGAFCPDRTYHGEGEISRDRSQCGDSGQNWGDANRTLTGLFVLKIVYSTLSGPDEMGSNGSSAYVDVVLRKVTPIYARLTPVVP
jgi:hypothetical protein